MVQNQPSVRASFSQLATLLSQWFIAKNILKKYLCVYARNEMPSSEH